MGRTAGQTLVLALVTLGAMGCVCSLTTRSLHRVVTWFAPINGELGIAPLPSPPLPLADDPDYRLQVLASIGICTALLVLTPNKHSARWVFMHFTDGSGWGSKFFSFLLGCSPLTRPSAVFSCS